MTKRLRTSVWACVFLTLLSAASLTYLSARQDRRADLDHGQDVAIAVASSLEEQASAAIRDITNGLFGAEAEIRSNGGVAMMNEPTLSYTLRREFRDRANIVDIIYLDLEGRPLGHMAENSLQNQQYPPGSVIRHHLRSPRDRAPHVGEPLYGPTYKRWLLPISVPVSDTDDGLIGVIVALIDIEYFQSVYARLNPRKGWEYTLTTTDGVVVTHYPPRPDTKPLLNGAPVLAKDIPTTRFFPQELGRLHSTRGGETDQFVASNPYSGRQFIYSARKLREQPFILYVGIDREEHLAQWRHRTLEKAAGIGLLTLVLTFSAIILLRAVKRAAHDNEITNAVLRCAGDSIMLSRGGTIIACNDSTVLMYGAKSQEDFVGRPTTILWPQMQPGGNNSERIVQDMYYFASKNGSVTFEFVERRFDGTQFTADVKLTALLVEGEAYYLSITRDITDRKKAEEDIRKLNVELESRVARRTEQLTQAKSDLESANANLQSFSYSIAHDIRAPVRHILGFTDMILMDESAATLNQNIKGLLSRVHGSGRRINSMIDSLLSLGRVDQQSLKEIELDLASLAENIVQGLRAREPQRDIDIDIEPGMTVKADPILMHMALENLLSNAWKFTGKCATPRIRFAKGQDDAGTHFFINDNGAGFALESAGKMFEPFARMHSSEEYPGTGVGLATVQRIILRHGGSIWADAIPGEGATFYITLGERDARVYRKRNADDETLAEAMK